MLSGKTRKTGSTTDSRHLSKAELSASLVLQNVEMTKIEKHKTETASSSSSSTTSAAMSSEPAIPPPKSL